MTNRPKVWEPPGNGPTSLATSPDSPAISRKPATDHKTDGMLDKARLAAYLGLSYRSLDRCLAVGVLPAPDLTIGRSPRWLATTIEKWLKSRPRLPGRGRGGRS
jgi:hypothetical protein